MKNFGELSVYTAFGVPLGGHKVKSAQRRKLCLCLRDVCQHVYLSSHFALGADQLCQKGRPCARHMFAF